MKYKYILFDLDGTIAESAPGIRYSLEMTLRDMNVTGVDLSDYTKYIGPPLLDTLRNLCKLPPQLCERGYDIYKQYYARKGIFMNRPYDGIEEVLKSLKHTGARLAVCSSKLEESALRVMKDIGLDAYFDAICGSNRDGTRKDKRDLIPYAVEKLGGSMNERERAVMLGDTYFDAKGAEECSVDFIACLYGYGDNKEMEKYNPAAFAREPGDISEILK